MSYKITVVCHSTLVGPACVCVESKDMSLMRKITRDIGSLIRHEHKPISETWHAGGAINVQRFNGCIESIADGLITKGYSVEKF